MRRKSYKKYLILGGTLLLLLLLPLSFVEGLRCRMIAFFSPILRRFASQEVSDIQKLESENYVLKLELARLKAALGKHTSEPSLVVAHVIYRNPQSWGSTLWVDVGTASVEKNSPVIAGGALVGLVDYVGRRQVRVRLITDRGVKPSVRAVRGGLQNSQLNDYVESVLAHLRGRTDLSLSSEEIGRAVAALEQVQKSVSRESAHWYLAKGIVEGGSPPLWRSRHHALKGIGFNYDFADSCGPARALLSDPPIIQAHDLLVTTGLDGIFPPGLRVAEVSKVFPLREGAYAYEIEAVPVVKNLDSIQTMFILPNIYDESRCTQRDGAR